MSPFCKCECHKDPHTNYCFNCRKNHAGLVDMKSEFLLTLPSASDPEPNAPSMNGM